MDKLNNMKREYESISAPENLYTEALELFGRQSRGRGIRRKILSLAAAAALFAIIVNVCPGVASAVSAVPVLGTVVDTVTSNRHKENTDDRPLGLLGSETEQMLSGQLDENAQAVIAAIEEDIIAYGVEALKMSVSSQCLVKSDTDSYLSLNVCVESNLSPSSYSSEYYTVDKEKGVLVGLSDLFKDGCDYKAVLTEYIEKELPDLNDTHALYKDIDPAKLIDTTEFYLDEENRVVLCMDGTEIVIPNEIIEDILK